MLMQFRVGATIHVMEPRKIALSPEWLAYSKNGKWKPCVAFTGYPNPINVRNGDKSGRSSSLPIAIEWQDLKGKLKAGRLPVSR